MQCRCAEILVPGLELRLTAAGRSPVLRCYGRFSAPVGDASRSWSQAGAGWPWGCSPPLIIRCRTAGASIHGVGVCVRMRCAIVEGWEIQPPNLVNDRRF